MKRTHISVLGLIAVFAFVLAACSTTKDAYLNRTYHGLVTRDNGWFNANEKLKEDVAAMEKAFVDDYDEVLPIFIYGTDEQAKALIPDMEKCIEKCATVIHRHSMEIGGEKNKWIDDAYFVIGKAHFYKRSWFDADRTFGYIGRRFKGQDRHMEGKLWYVRTAIQQEQYSKAQSTLDEIKGAKVLPKHFPHAEMSALEADLDLQRGKVDDAIVALEHAVDICKSKKQRLRWMFVLAQLYEMKGEDDKAVATYLKVAHSNPPYELGFHAQIAQALAFNRGSSKDIRKKLARMLRDEKNKDHFDLLHYALADLDLKENLDSADIVQLKESALTSTTDTRQKAKSFLRLADLYFDDKQYPPAQQYYDSTQALIPETHKRFEEVKTRAEVLTELVQQLDIITHEDSLQEFARLSPEDQEKRVKKLIKAREQAEDDKAAAEAAAREVVAADPKLGGTASASATSDQSAWYFYNPNTISRGFSEFKKKWGPRTNDDDWRRKDKAGSTTIVAQEDVQDTASDAKDEAKSKDGEPAWKDPASYLKDLPKDSAAFDASNGKICEAMYLSGMIYKEKLKDEESAIESFQVLNNRFDDCHYTPESYYQLYRIFLRKEKTGSYFGDETSQQYADTIMKRWPDSEFARLVRDPNQIQKDVAAQQMEDSLYADAYHQYRAGYYLPVISTCNTVITEQPKNHLLAKYALLKAMAVGGLREMVGFRAALTEVKNNYPGSDEAKAAEAILAALDKQAGGPPTNKQPGPEATIANYTQDQGQHFFVLMFPNADGDIQPVKTKISNFNQQYFPNTTIQVENVMLDKDNQVVTIKVFESKLKAMEYYELFLANKDILIGVNDQGYASFAISPVNYALFYKSKDVDGYSSFFSKNYLEGQ